MQYSGPNNRKLRAYFAEVDAICYLFLSAAFEVQKQRGRGWLQHELIEPRIEQSVHGRSSSVDIFLEILATLTANYLAMHSSHGKSVKTSMFTS